jgi:hypothetical protein
VRFGYIGTVSAKVPLPEFAQGWSLAHDRSAALAGATAQIWGYLGFYAEPNPALLDLVERHGAAGLTYAGPLSKGEVRATFETFDALLLLLGSGEYVTSGKVYEYAASALPIVSVHSAANAASDVLRDYPLWFPAAGLDAASIADALDLAARAAREAGPEVRRACHDFALPYRRDLQLAPRVAALHTMCTPPRPH